LRVGDYRVLYEFDVNRGCIYLHYVGHRRDVLQAAQLVSPRSAIRNSPVSQLSTINSQLSSASPS
jgi:hypothetical protein